MRIRHGVCLGPSLRPAVHILDHYLRDVYRDGPLDDARFLRLGVCRVLGQAASGRDFLQGIREIHGEDIARSTFFDGLHNIRHRDVLARLNAEIVFRHNLLVLLRGELEREHGVREEKVERKREGQVADRKRRARAAGRQVAAVQKLLPVAVQLTARYIRSIRNGILVGMRWIEALRNLRAATIAYL